MVQAGLLQALARLCSSTDRGVQQAALMLAGNLVSTAWQHSDAQLASALQVLVAPTVQLLRVPDTPGYCMRRACVVLRNMWGCNFGLASRVQAAGAPAAAAQALARWQRLAAAAAAADEEDIEAAIAVDAASKLCMWLTYLDAGQVGPEHDPLFQPSSWLDEGEARAGVAQALEAHRQHSRSGAGGELCASCGASHKADGSELALRPGALLRAAVPEAALANAQAWLPQAG